MILRVFSGKIALFQYQQQSHPSKTNRTDPCVYCCGITGRPPKAPLGKIVGFLGLPRPVNGTSTVTQKKYRHAESSHVGIKSALKANQRLPGREPGIVGYRFGAGRSRMFRYFTYAVRNIAIWFHMYLRKRRTRRPVSDGFRRFSDLFSHPYMYDCLGMDGFIP